MHLALEYLQEAASDLSHEEQQRAVLAMREHHPSEYGTCLGASRVGDLPRSVQVALHYQARALFGSRAGVPPAVAAVWDAEDGEGGMPSQPTTGEGSTVAARALSVGEAVLGGLTPGVQQGTPRGRAGGRGPGLGRSHSAGQQPQRASSRVRAAAGQFWVVQRPDPARAPSATPHGTHGQAASARTGGAGAGGSRRRQ